MNEIWEFSDGQNTDCCALIQQQLSPTQPLSVRWKGELQKKKKEWNLWVEIKAIYEDRRETEKENDHSEGNTRCIYKTSGARRNCSPLTNAQPDPKQQLHT